MNWKDIKLGKKLMVGMGAVLIMLAVVCTWAIFGISNIVKEGIEVANGNKLRGELLQREVDHLTWAQTVSRFVYNENAKELKAQTDPTQCAFGKWYYGEGRKEAEKLLPNLKDSLIAIEEPHRKLHESASNIQKAHSRGQFKEAQNIFENVTLTQLGEVQGFLAKMRDLAKENILSEENMVKSAGATRTVVLIVGILAIIFGVILGTMITRSIIKPINKGVEFAQMIAEGDLSRQLDINQKDEIGLLAGALNTMAEKLKKVLSDVKSTADNLASSSHELSASSEQMSRGLSEQAGRSSQIATASNQMSQTVVDVAKNSSNIASSASDTLKVADNGQEIVGKSVEEVKAIADTVNESAKLVSSLGERSKQIGEIVNVIKDIADQTNLLALNAAIEAARAGEQGRGFAVVADEVRKLAERTAKATSEISGMIGAIQEEMDKAVASMEDGTKRVEVGVEFSVQAGDALKKIVGSVTDLQSMVQQIATATEEMSTASEQISGDIDTIANVSKETSVSSDQVSQASSDLARLAGNLQTVVGMFKV